MPALRQISDTTGFEHVPGKIAYVSIVVTIRDWPAGRHTPGTLAIAETLEPATGYP
jgi:hypothetical protein